jgi:hypothetical protein
VFGFCPSCREYRSDADKNAWGFDWIDDTPVCRKCGSVIDIMGSEDNFGD